MPLFARQMYAFQRKHGPGSGSKKSQDFAPEELEQAYASEVRPEREGQGKKRSRHLGSAELRAAATLQAINRSIICCTSSDQPQVQATYQGPVLNGTTHCGVSRAANTGVER